MPAYSSTVASLTGELPHDNRGFGLWSSLNPRLTSAIGPSSTKWRIKAAPNRDETRAERTRALHLAADMWEPGSLPAPDQTWGYGPRPATVQAAGKGRRQRARATKQAYGSRARGGGSGASGGARLRDLEGSLLGVGGPRPRTSCSAGGARAEARRASQWLRPATAAATASGAGAAAAATAAPALPTLGPAEVSAIVAAPLGRFGFRAGRSRGGRRFAGQNRHLQQLTMCADDADSTASAACFYEALVSSASRTFEQLRKTTPKHKYVYYNNEWLSQRAAEGKRADDLKAAAKAWETDRKKIFVGEISD